LTHAPLDRVVCQVKFPAVFSIAAPEFIGPFQERIRKSYPRASQQQMLRFQLNLPGNESPAPASTPMASYMFEDEAQQWRVTLTQDALSLDTGSYILRADFLEHLAELVHALEACIRPTHRTRIGVRYINRISGAANLEAIPGFFRQEILGLLSFPDFTGHVDRILTEAIMDTPEGKLLARWGLLAANSTYEPLMVGPRPEDSWMLDLDAFCEARKVFNTDEVMADVTALAERSCAFFQWATTDKFFTHFR
jgi:uncharacterized protein (TIGR04255 family)